MIRDGVEGSDVLFHLRRNREAAALPPVDIADPLRSRVRTLSISICRCGLSARGKIQTRRLRMAAVRERARGRVRIYRASALKAFPVALFEALLKQVWVGWEPLGSADRGYRHHSCSDAR